MKNWSKGAAAVFLTVALCNFGISLAVSATTNGWAVSYIKYAQEQSNWCWAACAQASGRHENSNSVRTQTQIVAAIKGQAVNQTASADETVTACEFASLNSVEYATGSGDYPFEFYVGQLVNDNVTIVGFGYYTDANIRVGGHMATIGAARIVAGSSRFYTYFDPAEALTIECSSDVFRNGNEASGTRLIDTVIYPQG